MFLTSEIPTSWIDLQDKVCEYLVQAGYHAETAKQLIPLEVKLKSMFMQLQRMKC